MNHQMLDFWRQNSPFNEFNQLQKLLDGGIAGWPVKTKLQRAVLSPSCELTENKSHYHVRFDLPGLTKEQIKIDLHEGLLTVSGERREEVKDSAGEQSAGKPDDRRTHLSEVYYGSFSRSFSFPQNVDAERTEAKYENGVLTITVPKTASAQVRQVAVK